MTERAWRADNALRDASKHPERVGWKLHVIGFVAERRGCVGQYVQPFACENDLPALAHIHLRCHGHRHPVRAGPAADEGALDADQANGMRSDWSTGLCDAADLAAHH